MKGGLFVRVSDFSQEKANGTFQVAANGRPIIEGQGPAIMSGCMATMQSSGGGNIRMCVSTDGRIFVVNTGQTSWLDGSSLSPDWDSSINPWVSAEMGLPSGYITSDAYYSAYYVKQTVAVNETLGLIATAAKRSSDNVHGLLLSTLAPTADASVIAFIPSSGFPSMSSSTSYTYISGVYWSDGDIYCTNQSNRSLLYKVTADGSTPQLKTINADIFDSFHPQLGLVRTGQIWCKLSDVWTNGAFTPAYYISDEHPFTNGIRIPAPTTFLKDIGNFLIYSDAATMYSQPKWLGNVSSVALLPEPITKTNQQSMQVTYRLTVDFSGN
ncbi:hypothetical protein FACS18949_06130 [Clostridia bacterium]|nr:hypothetical protein FACS18949_06130 [Clostridia bacterium]